MQKRLWTLHELVGYLLGIIRKYSKKIGIFFSLNRKTLYLITIFSLKKSFLHSREVFRTHSCNQLTAFLGQAHVAMPLVPPPCPVAPDHTSTACPEHKRGWVGQKGGCFFPHLLHPDTNSAAMPASHHSTLSTRPWLRSCCSGSTSSNSLRTNRIGCAVVWISAKEIHLKTLPFLRHNSPKFEPNPTLAKLWVWQEQA